MKLALVIYLISIDDFSLCADGTNVGEISANTRLCYILQL